MKAVRAHQPCLAAVVVAAGSSTRFGQDKLFSSVAGKPLICTTLEALCRVPVGRLALVCRLEDHARIQECVARAALPRRVHVFLADGGSTRAESVLSGLNVLVANGASDQDWVLVHDGARPLVSRSLLKRLLTARETGHVVIPVIPVADSLRRTSGCRTEALERSGVLAVQTPQLCQVTTLLSAYSSCPDGASFGDEAALIESTGGKVLTVAGETRNIKVTVPQDVEIVEAAFNAGATTVVGFGYDVHRFASGRPLVLGGIRISSSLGLDGTSDADAVLHAVMDAVLGCTGAGDIGGMFPSSDGLLVGIDSSVLLERVLAERRVRRLRIVSVDITIVAERPRLQSYQVPMQQKLSHLLGLRSTEVDVKVTGNDGIGWIGRGEGIAALCVVTALRPQ
ncbi:MAG: 2-C-methyl-D-erythritol 2,4-cyclodiphosphate synthase [Caldiserica bacterium]|nr:2-C-methyl-D-erythritol 2,4-cyclodiphosphate synthase [Caldisericota bacterium]